VSSYRSRALRRGPVPHIPFLAAHHRVSAAAPHAKLPNAHRYPAIVLAAAAVAVAIAPLTASADSSTAASTTVKHTAVKHTAAATSTKAAASAAKKSTNTQQSTAAKSPATSSSTATAKSASATASSSNAYSGVSISTLEPTGTVGGQQYFTADSAQWQNATAIVQAAEDLNLSPYAATIAVATAMQESSLRNLTTATNADSLGLFQQRPSMGWGTASELTDPTYAAKAFLKELPSGYQSMALSDAAQSVQRSFDGSLYAQWEDQAAHMVQQIANA